MAPTGEHEIQRRDPILDVYCLVLAAFLFVSPWLLGYASRPARIDFLVSGAAIAIVSAAAMRAFAEWQEWLKLLLGIGLILAPWLIGFVTYARAEHMSVVIGSLIAYLATLELWLAHHRD